MLNFTYINSQFQNQSLRKATNENDIYINLLCINFTRLQLIVNHTTA